jgi:hypothetical protein
VATKMALLAVPATFPAAGPLCAVATLPAEVLPAVVILALAEHFQVQIQGSDNKREDKL